RTPYTSRNGEAVGGVEIMATTFLNLVKGDWLRRPSAWIEALVLVFIGLLLGGLSRARPLAAFAVAAGAGFGFTFCAVSLRYFTNYWFPWLVVTGGQVPCALACALVVARVRRTSQLIPKTIAVDAPTQPIPATDLPDAPDYQLFDPPFAEGSYGKVWLARNA